MHECTTLGYSTSVSPLLLFVKITAQANLGLAAADSRRMADRLEFVGRAVEENSFCLSLPKMSLERGEQFRGIGSKSLRFFEGTPGFGTATRKRATKNNPAMPA